MRKIKLESFLPVSLCAVCVMALLAACGRGADSTPPPAARVAQSQTAPAPPQAPPLPPANELQPPPQSVSVPPAPPPPAAPSLADRERDLAARAAALDA